MTKHQELQNGTRNHYQSTIFVGGGMKTTKEVLMTLGYRHLGAGAIAVFNKVVNAGEARHEFIITNVDLPDTDFTKNKDHVISFENFEKENNYVELEHAINNIERRETSQSPLVGIWMPPAFVHESLGKHQYEWMDAYRDVHFGTLSKRRNNTEYITVLASTTEDFVNSAPYQIKPKLVIPENDPENQVELFYQQELRGNFDDLKTAMASVELQNYQIFE